MSRGRLWTTYELGELRVMYGSMSSREIGLQLDRSEEAINVKVSVLGLSSEDKRKARRLECKEYITKHIGKISYTMMASRLGVSDSYITKLSKELSLPNRRRRWSDGDIELLEDSYEYLPVIEIAKALGRSRKAVVEKANKLGLKQGVVFKM